MAIALVLAAFLGSPAWGYEHDHVHEHEVEEEAPHDPSVGHKILFYLPNRVLDLLDVVRARVRIGPGIAVGARATEFVDVFLGSYTSLYVRPWRTSCPGGRRVSTSMSRISTPPLLVWARWRSSSRGA